MGLYSGGLIIGRIFVSEIWGAYFREGLFLGELIIGSLRHIYYHRKPMFRHKNIIYPKILTDPDRCNRRVMPWHIKAVYYHQNVVVLMVFPSPEKRLSFMQHSLYGDTDRAQVPVLLSLGSYATLKCSFNSSLQL